MANTRPTDIASTSLFTTLKWEHQLGMAAVRQLLSTNMKPVKTIPIYDVRYLGQHILAEFKAPKAFAKLIKQSKKPENIIHEIIVDAALSSNATVLKHAAFQQTKRGDICGMVVIEESHFSIHYLPQHEFLAVDAFTCGEIDLHAGIQTIEKALKNAAYDQINLKRGLYGTQDNKFVAGIATQLSDVNFTFLSDKSAKKGLGQHYIAEFYLCQPGKINDADLVLRVFEESIEAAGGDVSFRYVHEFKPQGISAVVMGEGFHLTVHDWPEWSVENYGSYAAIDLCVFNNKINGEQVLQSLADNFGAQKVAMVHMARGLDSAEERLIRHCSPII